MLADNDLLSMQQARILAENAAAAQKKLADFSQDRLDAAVRHVAGVLAEYAGELASQEWEETGYGNPRDKEIKNRFACLGVGRALEGLKCVGALKEDGAGNILEVGVPRGPVAALCSSLSAVSALISTALAAIKSGNAVVFSLHPRAVRSMQRASELAAEAAADAGLPEGTVSCLSVPARRGAMELMSHPAIRLVLNSGADRMLGLCNQSGKPVIYGGTGNGPAFIERTADLAKAAEDIISSKIFDCGTSPSAEQCVVVDAPAEAQAREAFRSRGAYFMTDREASALGAMLFQADGRHRRDLVGVDAPTIARRAGFEAPGATVLMADRRFVSETDSYNRELLAPILPWYVEDDWRHACEKCIELLLYDRSGHSLSIHSSDKEVVRQFALKKPVARVLVNAPACFAGMGATSGLFPAVTLGSSFGLGITSDNLSPFNLVYIRRIGYAQRSTGAFFAEMAGGGEKHAAAAGDPDAFEELKRSLSEAIRRIYAQN